MLDLQKKRMRPHNSVYVFSGLRAWEKTAGFQMCHPGRALCLPPWLDPYEFHWPVMDCSVLVHDTLGSDLEYIDCMAEAAFRDGAASVHFIQQDFNCIKYDKEMS